MHLLSTTIAISVLLPLSAFGQTIPRSIAMAEAEGAATQRIGQTDYQVALTGRSMNGTIARRCVTTSPADAPPTGSLRSGEIIMRTDFRGGFRRGGEEKVLWLPLHTAAGPDQPLVLRLARVSTPSDSLRKTVARVVRSHGTDGYPTSLIFPAAGKWLVVATTGDDWGCFVLTVAG